MLSLRDVHAYYGHVHALMGIDLDVKDKEIVCLLGANGAGKSTTLKSVIGLVDGLRGEVFVCGQSVAGWPPSKVVALGVAVVPEGRRIFPDLSVAENLMMGAYAQKDRRFYNGDKEYVFSIFPKLSERLRQLGGTLSGGEQQMLAIGRALMSHARILMMDEPSMGLAPIMREEIFRTITTINQRGTSILLVEQNAVLALSVAQRGYVMETGRIVMSGLTSELTANSEISKAYLGKGWAHAMLLAWLGQRKQHPGFIRASQELMIAIRSVLSTGNVRTPDLGGVSTTSEMCRAIREALLQRIVSKDREG